MKVKRLLLLVLALSLLGTATVFANDAAEWYKAKKVKVKVNGETLKAGGLLVTMDDESKTMLPLRDIANTLQAVVEWDEATQTVSIFKPNVHIALSTLNKDGSFGTFGSVNQKKKTDFFIFAQLDTVTMNIDSLKVEIVDPFNDVVYTSEHKLNLTANNDQYWFRTPHISMEFKYVGKYKVKTYMKTTEKGEYYLVSEKGLDSIK